MQKSNQTGFATIEAGLILVVVAILGFTGWFVWQAKQNTDKSLDAANNSQQAQINTKKTDKKQTSQTKDETVSWLLYEPPGKEYSIRLADGWKLTRFQDTSGLSTFLNTDSTAQPGTKAVVTSIEGGKDGRTGFFLNHATQNIDQISVQGTKQILGKTNDGLEIEKYYFVETSDKLLGPGPQKGDTQYSYIVRKSSNRVVVVNYSFQPEMADYHETVEKVIKTVHFN